MGNLIVHLQQVQHHPNWYGHKIKNEARILIEISAPLTRKETHYKTIASVKSILDKRETHLSVEGKIVVYFPLAIESIAVGDQLLIIAKPTLLLNNGAPGSFEFASYYQKQQIFYQTYIKQQNILHLHKSFGPKLSNWQYAVRNAIVLQLHQHIKDSTAAGLAAAILIGYKDELDQELYQTYAKTGVVHVIAISGMHLGLIYWIFQLLTLPINRIRYWKWMRFFIQLVGIWGFTLLTGAAPSILRAAVMITCLMIGKMAQRKGNMINSLCASAFILLCMHPWWLWDAGFLLSYSALAGILIYQQRIYQSITFHYRWLDYFWKFNSVTIAAQILTTPLSIYYFHQFPNYFLLSNMIAVPLSTALLFLEIILCTLGYWNPLGSVTGFFLEHMMFLLNQTLYGLASLPGALTEGFQWTLPMVLMVYGCIACLSVFLVLKNRTCFIYAIIFVGGIVAQRVNQFYKMREQTMLIVYATRKHHAVSLIKGSSALLSCDDAIIKKKGILAQQLMPTLHYLHIKDTSFLRNQDAKNFWIKTDKYIIYFLKKDNADGYKNLFGLGLPILVVSSNIQKNQHNLLHRFHPVKVIADGSVTSSQLKAWDEACKQTRIPFHAVVEKGAFVMNL